RIQQLDEPLAREQLALLALALDRLLGPRVLGLVAQLPKLVQLGLGGVGARVVGGGHGRSLVWLRVYEFRLLGPLEAFTDGNPVSLAAAKPRALLALLLLNRNRVVPTEKLIDELWGDEAPARAMKTLQVYVSQLRKELGPDRLLTRAPGYELRVGEGELDVDRFEKLAAEARARLAAGDAADAVEGMRRALQLWRGPALVEFRTEPFAERAAARLEDLRLAAVEDLLHAALEAGEAAGIVPELGELVASHP